MHYDHGIPNFAKVSRGVYRSGQIATVEGWQHLREVVGPTARVHIIKLNFDNEGSDALGVSAIGADIHYLPIQPQGDTDLFDDLKNAFTQPDMDRVNQAVSLLYMATDEDVWLVHCTHGQDRTGFVVGTYRVGHDGWPKVRAYEEMLAHDFHAALHGLHEAWEALK
jgi:hypothetical protein